MHMQDKEMLLEVVPGAHLQEEVQKLRILASVAGIIVGLTVKNGATFLSVKYSEEFTEFIRTRNAGRPKQKGKVQLLCGEISSLKESEGAKVAAAKLHMSIATFYRHLNDNKGKKKEDEFV